MAHSDDGAAQAHRESRETEMAKTAAELKAASEAEDQGRLVHAKTVILAELETYEGLPEDLKREAAQMIDSATVQDLDPMQRTSFSASFLKRVDALLVQWGF
jgi:hypothetical protein